MLTLKCRACDNSLANNEWIDRIKDYNDLCNPCLSDIADREMSAASIFLAGHGDSLEEDENSEDDYETY